MSILQNLKMLNKPINELAMLDQTTIMQMAQTGQIPAEYVAPILSEKARLAEAGANAAAMAQTQKESKSVLDKLVAQNAASDVRQQMAGLETLPVREDMGQGYAGGGIVAFAGGSQEPITSPFSINQPGGVDKAKLRAWYIANGLPLPEELRSGSDAPVAPPRSMAETDPLLREFNALPKPKGPGPASDLSELFGNVFKSVSSVGSQTRIDPTTGKEISFGDYRRMREQGGAPATGMPSKDEMRAAAERTRASMTPGGLRDLEAGRVGGEPTSYQDVINFMKTAKGEATTSPTAEKTAAAPKAPADVAKKAAAAGKTIKEYMDDLRGAYREAGYDFESIKDAEEERIAKQEMELGAQKKEDAWLAVLQGSLASLGGESPYALTNLGKGFEKGAEAYGKSNKERRAAQKELDKAKTDLVKAEQLDRKGMADEAFKLRDKALSQVVEQQKADASTLAAQAAWEQANNPRDTSLRAAALTGEIKLVETEAALIKNRLDGVRAGTDAQYNKLIKDDKKNNTNTAAVYLANLEKQYMSVIQRGRATINQLRPGGAAPAGASASTAGFSAKEIK